MARFQPQPRPAQATASCTISPAEASHPQSNAGEAARHQNRLNFGTLGTETALNQAMVWRDVKRLPPSRRQYVRTFPASLLAKKIPGAKPAPFPGFIEPLLATLRPKSPSGDQWVHEIKYDGYRLQAHVRE